jgi:hypothetical protein
MTLLDKWRKERGLRFGRKKKPEESPDRGQLPLSEFPAEDRPVGMSHTNGNQSQIETTGSSGDKTPQDGYSENIQTRLDSDYFEESS